MGDYYSDAKRHENNVRSVDLYSVAQLQKRIGKLSHYDYVELNKLSKLLTETTAKLIKE
jgi:uncharacterized small protein (DUF1192 family)